MAWVLRTVNTFVRGRIPYSTNIKITEGGDQVLGVEQLQAMVAAVIPPLSHNLHKGQAGRIGIIGGCQEYTGAPYFSAITAMKVGADLAHVFCTREAAPVIKSYSPDLIVHPVLDSANAVEEIQNWLPRLHVLVIGPGLGRDPSILKTVTAIIERSKERSLPMVIDADGMFLITESPDLVRNYSKAILTPNCVEFQRLFDKVIGEQPVSDIDAASNTKLLAERLGHVTLMHKGMDDIISDGKTSIVCSAEGSPRRCGGQGDLLSGSTAAFFHWALTRQEIVQQQVPAVLGPGLLACYMGCRLIRECSRRAFSELGRSTLASDLIPHIHQAFQDVLETPATR